MVICGVDPILEFGPQVWPGVASGGSAPVTPLAGHVFPLMLEVFLNRAQNLLADTLLHLCITRAQVTSIALIHHGISPLSLLWLT